MFEVNDKVMYGQMGACIISAIEEKEVNSQKKLYYVINPVNAIKTTIFCPVDNDKVRIRKLISKEKVMELVAIMPDIEAEWIENDSIRKAANDKIIKSGEHEGLIKLIKLLYFKREECKANNKKFHIADQRAMETAEKLLYSEFAMTLGIKEEEVLSFIVGKLKK